MLAMCKTSFLCGLAINFMAWLFFYDLAIFCHALLSGKWHLLLPMGDCVKS
jgi:hypothetical protein